MVKQKTKVVLGALALALVSLGLIQAQNPNSTTTNLGLSNGFQAGAMTQNAQLNANFSAIDAQFGSSGAALVTKGGTGLTSGTSGGVLAFTGTTTIASSAALTANSPVLGGGAGVVPATVAGITTDGISILTLGVAGTSVGKVALANATSGTVSLAPPTGALGTPTVTTPAITGSLPTGYTCGTIAANGACTNTALGGTAHIVSGIATLAGSTSTITGLSPAFTSSSSFYCIGNDITTRANPVQVIPASASTVTITNTTGATDNVQFICFGN